jgi:hypothetical protein
MDGLHDMPLNAYLHLYLILYLALKNTSVKISRSRFQGNRMKIAFCRNNACKDSGQKGAGFPPAREQRSAYSIAGQQNIHSIALGSLSLGIAFF